MTEENANEIIINPPVRCTGCGLKSKDIAKQGGWLTIDINSPAVFLFACPKCGAVFTNTNAKANIKKIQEIRERRIIPASSLPVSGN